MLKKTPRVVRVSYANGSQSLGIEIDDSTYTAMMHRFCRSTTTTTAAAVSATAVSATDTAAISPDNIG